MCGFVGLLTPDRTVDLDLDVWSESVRHRGPDQAGHASDNHFGLGTRRLSIQDLSDAGNQPMRGERYIIGFNGEIYNHHDLRSELRREGWVSFSSHSDTETVLRAIEYWGVFETLERLNGMYAIAIWDRYAQELSLARDPLGIKPIFYSRSGSDVYFASETKALRHVTSGKVSREGLALYLYFGFIPAPFSLLDGVRKVRPGERVVFSRSGVHSELIVPQSWRDPKTLGETWDERVLQVRSEVESAVERQLIADVPVGVFLSGGIDSTIIASVAAQSRAGISSFSLKPTTTERDPLAHNDARLAADFAKRIGFRHVEVSFDPKDVIDRLDSVLSRIDEPVSELYALGEIALSERARDEGVKVVLTGHGADEVFLGYPTYRAVFRGDLYNRIPLFGRAAQVAARAPLISEATRSNLLGAASIWRQAPLDRYATISGVHFTLEQAAALSGLADEHVRETVSQVIHDALLLVSLLPRANGDCNAEMFARMDLMLMVPEHYNTRIDRMTMSASIEARVPFQDLDLIGFVSRLSHEDLLQGGLKGMLRQAFHDALPPEIINRPKQTFQAPMRSWVTGPLAPWVSQHLSQLPEWVRRESPMNGHEPTTTRQAYQAWSLALLEAWRKELALEF